MENLRKVMAMGSKNWVVSLYTADRDSKKICKYSAKMHVFVSWEPYDPLTCNKT